MNREGLKVAAPNCLACHATHLNGQLIVGLGRPNHALANPSGTSLNIPGILLNLQSQAELTEFQTFGQRLINLVQTGELLAFATLASHRDPMTLAWSDTTHFDLRTGLNGWVDIPPWWRTSKQNALFAQGMGRGIQSRHMSFMSVFTVEDTNGGRTDRDLVRRHCGLPAVHQAAEVPGPINTALAAQGEQVFSANCTQCHGTYGANGSYPNILIPQDQVGTDSDLALKSWVNPATKQWFSESYYSGGGESWLDSAARVHCAAARWDLGNLSLAILN